MRATAVANTWAQEWRMRSSSVIDGVMRAGEDNLTPPPDSNRNPTPRQKNRDVCTHRIGESTVCAEQQACDFSVYRMTRFVAERAIRLPGDDSDHQLRRRHRERLTGNRAPEKFNWHG